MLHNKLQHDNSENFNCHFFLLWISPLHDKTNMLLLYDIFNHLQFLCIINLHFILNWLTDHCNDLHFFFKLRSAIFSFNNHMTPTVFLLQEHPRHSKFREARNFVFCHPFHDSQSCAPEKPLQFTSQASVQLQIDSSTGEGISWQLQGQAHDLNAELADKAEDFKRTR